jgi:hypothetical protein
MTVQFPAIRPAGRDFTSPSIPVRQRRSLAGVTFTQQLGSLAVDAELSLRFANRPDTEWELINAAWIAGRNGMVEVILPPETWAPDEAPILPGLQWRFVPDQRPSKSQDRERPGRFDTAVQLRAIAA